MAVTAWSAVFQATSFEGVPSGDAEGTTTWTGTASGESVHSGEATGTTTWTGVAQGGGALRSEWTAVFEATTPVGSPEGSASGMTTWTGSAVGANVTYTDWSAVFQATSAAADKSGSSVGTTTWIGTAVGKTPWTPGDDLYLYVDTDGGYYFSATGPGNRFLKADTDGSPYVDTVGPADWSYKVDTDFSPYLALPVRSGSAVGMTSWVGTAHGLAALATSKFYYYRLGAETPLNLEGAWNGTTVVPIPAVEVAP